MNNFHINHLQSGGLITNYNCTSKCRHCLYNCSPSRPKDYIDKNTAKKCFKKAKALGADALHIGGGEPMLVPEKLESVLVAAEESGMTIDYVETKRVL
jgi:MoaA/NifB/PqqE/SkfB family radical SAM enzyme